MDAYFSSVTGDVEEECRVAGDGDGLSSCFACRGRWRLAPGGLGAGRREVWAPTSSASLSQRNIHTYIEQAIPDKDSALSRNPRELELIARTSRDLERESATVAIQSQDQKALQSSNCCAWTPRTK
ncbi:hypothetical protein PABG_11316 [Paracoccidioides brasiliensis Pb03]|nr:hypothetical protein PABG_11316 [Paracoccidioides brasiliensis Pb03]